MSYTSRGRLWGSVFLLFAVALNVTAQQQTAGADSVQCEPGAYCASQPNSIRELGRNLLRDQKRIWTSPLRFRFRDARWVLPVTGIAAGLIAADDSIEQHVGTSHVHLSSQLSNAGVFAEIGAAGAFYLYGKGKHNEHSTETGMLSYEAAVNSLIVNTAIQSISRRPRPDELPRTGFFNGGTSFPSDHSAVAWSIASVVAHEYPGWGTKLLAYGTASAVSAARVGARKHFTSDVFVGSALGWLIGEETYRLHHNPELPGVNWNKTSSSVEHVREPLQQASTYVPLDSWIYVALDRLSALGYASEGMQGLRPWTRIECARIVDQAASTGLLENHEAAALFAELRSEFEKETDVLRGGKNLSISVDSVYSRFLAISGTPLTDSLHFGQTQINDFGRPYQEGLNLFTGFSSHAEAGPFAFYVRGEFQRSPSAEALPSNVLASIASTDGLPPRPGLPTAEVKRFRLLDAYATLNVGGWQASFGKQSLWWGPGGGGDLMLSDNAEPMTMLRLKRVAPSKLPGFLRRIGEIQNDTFLAQLDGYNFVRLGPTFAVTGSYAHHIDPQPFVWGHKLSIKPTPNLELGVSITTVFAGLGRPLTFDTFWHTFSSSGNAQSVEPGDRRTGFDFRYRLPGLRHWIVLYSGSMSEDEPNPIAYPRRSAMNPGIYLLRVPGIQKLDLHAEAVYTNLPNDPRTAAFYTNAHYANGYTNNGQIMGSWVGPEGRGYQLWSNYWQSAERRLRVGYRKQTVDRSYLQGGSLWDLQGSYTFPIASRLTADTAVQFERWNFPLLSTSERSNVSISVQLTYRPGNLVRILRHE